MIIDKTVLGAGAKVVYVSKDRTPGGIEKGAGTDLAAIDARFEVAYGSGATSGAFVIPAGATNGLSGWVVNHPKVARYVNRLAPSGPTGTKVLTIKPGKLLKIVGKSLGDAPIDILAAGAPGAPGVTTVFTITNGAFSRRLCTAFTDCTHRPIAADTGAKLVCKPGVPVACP